MTRLFEVLLVLNLLLGSKAQMNGLQETSHFLFATVGDNITLPCYHKDNSELGIRFYWFKQSPGMKSTIVSALSKYHNIHRVYGEFNSSKRFTLVREDNGLQMKHVQVSDSAVYVCLKCILYQIYVLESFTVIVKSLNIEAKVHQSPHEDTEERQSVTLECNVQIGSRSEQHLIHWFKQSEESGTGVLYTEGGDRSGQCKKSANNSTNSCVYSLHIHNVSSEQTGTYYCAVSADGQVLFGNGTKLRIKEGESYTMYILSTALVLSLVLVVALVFSLCRMKKKYHSLSAEFKCQYGSSAMNNGERQDQDVDLVNYAALRFHPASRRQRVTEETDCVYSSVQQD